MRITKTDKHLENANWDKYKLIELPLEELGDSSQELTGIEAAPTIDTAGQAGTL